MKKAIFAFVFIFLCGCTKPSPKPVAQDSSGKSNIYAAQSLMWYQTMKALRSKSGKSRELDFSTIYNYFPLYLHEEEIGEHNSFIFSFVSSICKDYDESELENNIFHADEDGFNAMNSTGAFSSFGFNEKDTQDYANFRKARSKYLSAIIIGDVQDNTKNNEMNPSKGSQRGQLR